jgi:apolipoprotein N-acyltransferase
MYCTLFVKISQSSLAENIYLYLKMERKSVYKEKAMMNQKTAFRPLIIALTCLLVAFGQPSSSTLCAIATSTFAFTLFFSQIINLSAKARFFCGFGFFFAVQAFQLFWFTYHPFLYIWAIWVLLSALIAAQFGVLCLFVTKTNIRSWIGILTISSLWTILEWSRLFWLSGFFFNLVGLSLTATLIGLQCASLFGILGLSFWVMLTNMLIFRGWKVALGTAVLPYLFGIVTFVFHSKKQQVFDTTHAPLQSIIVHAKKEPECISRPKTNPIVAALEDWHELIASIAPYYKAPHDLILMPEMSIPFGSNTLIFPRNEIESIFMYYFQKTPLFSDDFVSSEDIAQGCADTFGCPLIIGLEGTESITGKRKMRFFNSAFFFIPGKTSTQRYDKQVLVPMGEYIPFEWAKALAAKYGIFDSFTPGVSPVIFDIKNGSIGTSICYEETFGNLIRKNRQYGATILVNLTDDYWFPFSKLGVQHFDHARPRTVENGIPMLRSCNFGLSGAIDSLGKIIVAQEGTQKTSALSVSLSLYHYNTLYSIIGDLPLLLFCGLVLFWVMIKKIYKTFTGN